jgi:hypothetical protein
MKWSLETFGPGMRTEGICNHIRKELLEIEANPTDLMEWVDVILLAMDGASRAGYSGEEIVQALQDKQKVNETRTWPENTPEGEPSEHIQEDERGLPIIDIGDGKDVPF